MRAARRIERSNPARAARGFTFVEIMVAIALGLFLIGGLLTLVQAMRRTATNQSGLSQLQDNERMAMELITDVVQSTGYFTQPLTNTAASSFPAFTYNAAASFGGAQALVGFYTSATVPDVISNRYWTGGTNAPALDNAINCTGNSSPTAASFVNQITVNTATNYLTCTLWLNGNQPITVSLVPGITNMQVLYGVESGNGVSTNSIDAYINASLVTSGNLWSQVRSVQVTLTFINPMWGQPGQTSQYINFTRNIAVMYKTGVTT
jgi:type IV pilus assembly protein PilW